MKGETVKVHGRLATVSTTTSGRNGNNGKTGVENTGGIVPPKVGHQNDLAKVSGRDKAKITKKDLLTGKQVK